MSTSPFYHSITFIPIGSFVGLSDGFKDPISMVDGNNYDPDKAYKDSKLVYQSHSTLLLHVLLKHQIDTIKFERLINEILILMIAVQCDDVTRVGP